MSDLVNSGRFYRLQPQVAVDMQRLWKVMDDIQGAYNLAALNSQSIIALLSGYVQTVTDNGGGGVAVDNTDPQNPVVRFTGVTTDGVTITGDGTSGNPLVATTGGGGVDMLNPFLLMGG